MNPENVLSVADAARSLGVSGRTVRNLIARGDLRARRLGARAWAVAPADLQETRLARERKRRPRE